MMTNTERERLIKSKLQNKEWTLQCTKRSWKVKNKAGDTLAESPIKHDALTLAVAKTQGE